MSTNDEIRKARYHEDIQQAIEDGLMDSEIVESNETHAEIATKILKRLAPYLAPHPAQQGEDSKRTNDGITIGMKVWCDGEKAEVISFQPEGVEVKFFGHMGDRRCHTEVRDADELEEICEDQTEDQE